MNGDNPTSTSAVASCSHASSTFFTTDTGNNPPYRSGDFIIVDNFEWTGMCQVNSNQLAYISDIAISTTGQAWNIYSNNYFHGWTHLPFSGNPSCQNPSSSNVCFNEFAFNTEVNSQSTIGPGNVCDGWDSDPTGVGCIVYGGYLVYDNYFAHMAQIVINGCHDAHDNVVQDYYPTGDGDAHGNSWECNDDAPGVNADGVSQPNIPFNVFYNNVFGHNYGAGGDIKIQIAAGSTTAAEYDFNNVVYDQSSGNNWDYGCTGCGTPTAVYHFNNTFDAPSSGDTINCVANMTVKNDHVITEGGTGFQSGPCTISNDTVMNHATAVVLGFMAPGRGTSGSNGNTTCANDTTPCAPTSNSASTVGAAVNVQSYCTTLQGSTQSMIVNAGNACKYGTTDGCGYNTTTHTMSCPAQTAMARPAGGAWDAGAYQFSSTGTLGIPQGLSGVLK